MVRIEKKEFRERIEVIQLEMEEKALNGIMVYGDEYRKENLRYISNFWPIFERAAAFIGKKSEPIIAGAPEGEKYAQEMSIWSDYRNIKEFICVTVPEEVEYPLATFSSLKEILHEAMGSGKKLGIVGSSDIPHQVFERIREACPRIEIIPVDSILQKLRLVKSKAEVACLKEAGRLACLAYEELMKNAIPGNTELYAAGKAEGAGRSAGAEAIIFTVFGSGKRSNTIIGRPTRKVIEDGDMIMASIAVQYQGYVATVEFPFVSGEASPAQELLITSLIEARNAGLSNLRVGKPMKDFVRAVRNVFRKKNLSAYDIYPPLHGCGCAEAESPYPDEKTKMLFQSGMTVNTDISLFGHPGGSNRIEEGLVLTKDGFESLTPLIGDFCEEYKSRRITCK